MSQAPACTACLIPKMADCGGDQRKKQTNPEKKDEVEREWRNHKESQRRWCWAATCQTTAMYRKSQSPWKWKTKVPASDKHYWLGSFGKHLCFSFLLSNFKLSTSSFTHHPHVTKVRAALYEHVHTLTQLATRSFWINWHLVITSTDCYSEWIFTITIGTWNNIACN